MRIYSMTATFGKLENETLTLQPGLNIISAHNEWGKSTWCAFLTAMLYGMDTRAKSTKHALADKERYAPWSGMPMSGRIDLNWDGRDITIERISKGRSPLGVFRAYETHSGLEVPELNSLNCGQQLLGVERSVFLRAGFIRLNDMPVTDDEALRRRLNNLVTTGDESESADRLAKGLKDLKNRIRYNRSGLLPQAEAERDKLEEICRELEELEEKCRKVRRRLDETEDWRMALENHQVALTHAAAMENEKIVEQAARTRDHARQRYEEISALCETLPKREAAEDILAQINLIQSRMEDRPRSEDPSGFPGPFQNLNGEEAFAKAKGDWARHWELSGKRNWLSLAGTVVVLLGAAAAWWYRIPGLIAAAAGLIPVIAGFVLQHIRRKEILRLEKRYGDSDSEQWLRMAEKYAAALYNHHRRDEEVALQQQRLEQQLQQMQLPAWDALPGRKFGPRSSDWKLVLDAWDDHEDALRAREQAEHHYITVKAMLKTTPAPEFADRLDSSEEETARLLSECAGERHRLENLLGQYQGRMEALGDRAVLEGKLNRVRSRIARLEETCTALTLAQETLAEASAHLQRRFAPRIAARTQELMGRMTGGRYNRVQLGEDLRLSAGAQTENTIQSALWRSDGTVDQLYLALRLAVAEELTPEAPLVLDDALVRFDDTRLKAALEILKEESEKKQVILFTCQDREKTMV